VARAPQTGFYFEPLAERLALVIEGTAYPSDDHWAYIGDPMEGLTPELARIECANRWPGVDPETLEVEFNTDFDGLLAEIEHKHDPDPMLDGKQGEIDFDVNFLLQQADALREMAAKLVAPGARDLEAALEAPAPTVGDEIVRANNDD
jgi:hypothetical protein